MKTIFRVLMLGTMLATTGAVSVFAQDVCTEVEAKQALYKQFTDNYAGTVDQKKTAVQAGEQYVGKYGSCADDKDIVAYLNTNIPPMKKFISDKEAGDAKKGRYTRFDTALKANSTGDIYSSGREILAAEPDFLDVTIVLASAGFDKVVENPPVDTYNNDVLNYSRAAIDKLEAGKTSSTGDYGVLQYSYKTKTYTDGKSNALGLMNYNIGYINYYRQDKKKEALPYFYKATQYNSFSKTNPFIYQTIGAWYLDEAIRIDGERQKLLVAAGNKDTDETLAMVGTQKGYADRAIDAYARAYSLAKADTKQSKTYTDSLYTKLKELYNFRYNGNTAGIDTFVASVMNKPLPDPSTAITPVIEAVPAATPETGATKQTAMTSDNTSNSSASTAGMAKPTAKTATSSAANKTDASATGTAKPAAVKKPAPKKKGTR